MIHIRGDFLFFVPHEIGNISENNGLNWMNFQPIKKTNKWMDSY